MKKLKIKQAHFIKEMERIKSDNLTIIESNVKIKFEFKDKQGFVQSKEIPLLNDLNENMFEDLLDIIQEEHQFWIKEKYRMSKLDIKAEGFKLLGLKDHNGNDYYEQITENSITRLSYDKKNNNVFITGAEKENEPWFFSKFSGVIRNQDKLKCILEAVSL